MFGQPIKPLAIYWMLVLISVICSMEGKLTNMSWSMDFSQSGEEFDSFVENSLLDMCTWNVAVEVGPGLQIPDGRGLGLMECHDSRRIWMVIWLRLLNSSKVWEIKPQTILVFIMLVVNHAGLVEEGDIISFVWLGNIVWYSEGSLYMHGWFPWLSWLP